MQQLVQKEVQKGQKFCYCHCALSNYSGVQRGMVSSIHSSNYWYLRLLNRDSKGGYRFLWRWSNTGKCCPESLCSLCPWSVHNPVEHGPEQPVSADSNLSRGLDCKIFSGTFQPQIFKSKRHREHFQVNLGRSRYFHYLHSRNLLLTLHLNIYSFHIKNKSYRLPWNYLFQCGYTCSFSLNQYCPSTLTFISEFIHGVFHGPHVHGGL